ncbi:hypothetical protein ACWF95_41650 [Streptomyces vinaceus]
MATEPVCGQISMPDRGVIASGPARSDGRAGLGQALCRASAALAVVSAALAIPASPAWATGDLNGVAEARRQIAGLYADASDRSAVVAGHPVGAEPATAQELERRYGAEEEWARREAQDLFSRSPNNWPTGVFRPGDARGVWDGDGWQSPESYCGRNKGKCLFIGRAGDAGNAVPAISSSRVITGAPGGTKLTVSERTSVTRTGMNTQGFTVGVDAGPPGGGTAKASFSYNVSTTNVRTEASDHEERIEVTVPVGRRVTLRSFANGQTMGGYLAVMSPDKGKIPANFQYEQISMFPVTAFVGFNKAPNPVTWEVVDETKPN